MKITKNYVFFYKEAFSQWHMVDMTVDGVTYNCCEQYMMHKKALLFGDTEVAEEVMNTKHPRDQKALGRKVKGFDKAIWDKACVGIVFTGNLAKFSQNEHLKKMLLDTGDRILVEASGEDIIWGIGMYENDLGIEFPFNWKGTNLLGWCLTLVKREL